MKNSLSVIEPFHFSDREFYDFGGCQISSAFSQSACLEIKR